MFNDTIFEAVRRLPAGDIDFGWLGLGQQRVHDLASRRSLAVQLANRIKYLEPDEREEACRRLTRMASGSLPDDLMMNHDQVRALARKGLSIGGHTITHPILAKISLDCARQEIQQNFNVLKDLTGQAPACFAYPNGKPTLDFGAAHALVAREVGYTAAVSTAVGVATLQSDRYQMPRFVANERNGMSFIARMLRMATVRRSVTAA